MTADICPNHEPEENQDRPEYENELLTDAANYRSGHAKGFSLDEVDEILELNDVRSGL